MYIIFLITVTLALIFTAAYFSVFGIASMLSYNYIMVMLFGISLEAGKFGVAIYLFRYWTLMNKLFKYLLLTFLFALMVITSVGIFGYLSQGYQKTSEDFSLLSLKLSELEKDYFAKQSRLEVINNEVLKMSSDSVANKIRLSREFSDEQSELRDKLATLEPQIQKLKVERLAFESHIGPIAYVARMLHAEQDNVVFFAILMLVFVADPLAITLTIACNMVVLRYWEKSKPDGEQVESSPLMFDHFVTGVKAVANDTYGKYAAKKEAKKAARIAKQEAEAARKAEIDRKAEEARLADEAKRAEAARKAEAKRQAKLLKEAEKIRKKDEAKQVRLAKRAEKKRKKEEAKQAKLVRQTEKKRKQEEAKQAAAAQKAAEEKKAAAAARKAVTVKKAKTEKKKVVKKAVPAKKPTPVRKIASSRKGKGRKAV